MIEAPIEIDVEYEAARRRVLDPWGAEIRARLALTESLPSDSRRVHWPGPGPAAHVNRPAGRQPNSVIVKLADEIRRNLPK